MAYGSPMISRLIPALVVFLLSTAALGAPTKHPKPAEPPLTVESLLSEAHQAVGKGDTELAVRLAQSAIVADPARPTSYVALGDIYAVTGEPEYARSFYEEALDIDPANPIALKALANLEHSRPEDTARENQ
jgi:cytochrome c-type biogenesis protein CcmH/NrfG